MADTWPRKCLECGAEVSYDGNEPIHSGFGPCKKKPGNHTVESKIYFHPGARDIADIRDRKKFSPLVILQPVYTRLIDGKNHQSRGVSTQFSNGKMETADPEVQYYIELKKDIKTGEDGLRMWQEIYLSPQQQVEAANDELKRKRREIEDVNDLLKKVNEKKSRQAERAEANA